MFNKTMKKIICGALAMASVVACASTFTACETSHPEVEMKIEFNGETYTLDYKLYRKIAPTTVNHFLWLAENGYYDGLCVHDYDSSNESNLKMYTGGYEYTDAEDDDDNLVYKKYYDEIKSLEGFDSFPHSVWQDEGKKNPLYTLYGEFKNNKFEVENGALKENFGTLTMYYYAKPTTQYVYIARADSDKGEVARRSYEYNSATSMFYISLATSQTTNNNYCTFATLKKDGVEELKDLQEAINEYIDDVYEGELADFAKDTTVRVNTDDPIVGDTTKSETFSIPQKPIIIKSVKVKKY